MKNQCPVCGEPTQKPIAAALHHFRLYESGYWRYLRGNIKMFGLKDGLLGTMDLVCPAINTLRHWKYRKYRLSIPEGFGEAPPQEPGGAA